jgi:hypothetical protein
LEKQVGWGKRLNITPGVELERLEAIHLQYLPVAAILRPLAFVAVPV